MICGVGIHVQPSRWYLFVCLQYIGDQDDKQWLSENGYMPSTGGKAYLLILTDISDIAETDEYR